MPPPRRWLWPFCDEAFARGSRDFYRREAPRFVRALRDAGLNVRPGLRGLTRPLRRSRPAQRHEPVGSCKLAVWPSSVHFFLIETADDERVLRGLMERGLVARHTRNFPGLDGRYIRVATRLPGENDRLAEALRILREEGVF